MTYTHATGLEIKMVVQKIQSVLDGEPIDHAVMGCLAVALILHNIHITPTNLVEGIKGASEWIALYNDSLAPIDPKTVN